MPTEIIVRDVDTGSNNGNLPIQPGTRIDLYDDHELGILRPAEYFAPRDPTETLFSGAQSTPTIAEIRQSDVGNCLLLAITQAMVFVNPQTVINKFCLINTTCGQQVVCVQLHYPEHRLEWQPDPVIIGVRKSWLNARAYGLVHSGTRHTALWLQMLEKAYVAFIKKLNPAENLSYAQALSKNRTRPGEASRMLSGTAGQEVRMILPETIGYLDPTYKDHIRRLHAPYKNLSYLMTTNPVHGREHKDAWSVVFPYEARDLDFIKYLARKLRKKFIYKPIFRECYYEIVRKKKFADTNLPPS